MPDNGEAILSELLAGAFDDPFGEEESGGNSLTGATPQLGFGAGRKKSVLGNTCQWAVAGDGKFLPIGKTVESVPAGVYSPFAISPSQVGLELTAINSDGIYTLPDMATEAVIKEVDTFWNNEDRYRKHNLLYKRGVLLWGPPGSGKTITVKLLMQELIKRDGIVLIGMHVGMTTSILKSLRDIEPKRNIIVVLEDIDEIINYNGEASVLSLLDGEHNIDNVLNLATTNYPDRLGARIINRPSRFDRRVYVGMPSYDARRAYLSSATGGELTEADLHKWATDTEQLSIAHLRELVAAVYCLGQPYQEVYERLRAMGKQIKTKEDGFEASKSMGFSS
jgi:hypothetical protein